MVELNKEGIEIANKRSLRYILKRLMTQGLTARRKVLIWGKLISSNFWRVLMKLILLVKRKQQQMLKMKMQTKMRTLLQKPMLVMRMNSKILMMQVNPYCECWVCQRKLACHVRRAYYVRSWKWGDKLGRAVKGIKLSYVSLMHQITEAKSAEYDENCIVKSVVRAIATSLTLRNILEAVHNLTLKKLMQFLETHHDKRNTTKLSSKLTPLTQLPEEVAYSFVIDAMSYVGRFY